MSELPIYDVTGVCFVPGVTNFTTENLYGALRSVGAVNRENISLLLHVNVWDRLEGSDLLDHYQGGTQYRRCAVSIDPNSKLNTRFCDSTITSPCGKSVILRTREF